MDERGITDTIVYWITKYHASLPGHKVIVRKAVDEPRDGNDIDLYIRNSSGSYNRFALQAKVLFPLKVTFKGKGRTSISYSAKDYTGIQNSKGRRGFQWNMLMRGEKAGRFKGYYLLYNGYTQAQFNACGLSATTLFRPAFGCSLVRPKDVDLATQSGKPKRGRKIPRTAPGYEAFHSIISPKAKPWTSLVCDPESSEDYEALSYSITDILGDRRFIVLQPDNLQDVLLNESDNRGFQQSDDVITGIIQSDFGPRYQVILDFFDGT